MKRIEEFLNFHKRFVIEDDLVSPMSEFLKIAGYTDYEKWKFICFYATCYSMPTSIVFMNCGDVESFFIQNRSKLIFQSDRRWTRIGDRFIRAFSGVFQKELFHFLDCQKEIDIEKSIKEICKHEQFGRFSAFLLLESYMGVFGKNGFGERFDFFGGDTATSGLLNVMGMDRMADDFDRNGILEINIKDMQSFLNDLLSRLSLCRKSSLAFVETSLCAYRKLFKGTRYLGYYTDRCLGEINYYKEKFPYMFRFIEPLIDARICSLPINCLGELNGWSGIRKERTKYYKNGMGF